MFCDFKKSFGKLEKERKQHEEYFKNRFDKTLLLMHDDLDGIGVKIVGKSIFEEYKDVNVDYISSSLDTIDGKLQQAIKSGKYRVIIMADASPNDESVELINKYIEDGHEFVLLDHHKTALHLNKYPWATIKVETNGKKHCGTELLNEYFLNIPHKRDFNKSNFIPKFVEVVRKYDTWEWFYEGYNEANDLNTLYYFLGQERFEQEMLDAIRWNYDSVIPDKFKNTINTIKKIDRDYIEDKKHQIKRVKYNDTNIAVVFADKCSSVLGNEICQENDDIDFCCIVDLNTNKCSLRSKVSKTDVSIIAKNYNGGGHTNAAGFTFKSIKDNDLLQTIFNLK